MTTTENLIERDLIAKLEDLKYTYRRDIRDRAALEKNFRERFEALKRQNQLLPEHIEKIVETYQFRREEERYSLRVSMDRIEKEDYNLNISRYVSTSVAEKEINLAAVHAELVLIEDDIRKAKEKHNAFLKELGLPLLP